MSAPDHRLSRTGKILIALVVASMFAAAVVLEREFRASDRWRANQTAAVSSRSAPRWPGWVRDSIIVAMRRSQTVKASLLAASLCLTFATFRPDPLGRPRRPGPGLVAMMLAGGFSLFAVAVFARQEWFDPWLMPGFFLRIPGSPLMPLTRITRTCEVGVAGLIIPAWIYLAAIGRWRTATDPIETLGRWVGWGWIAVFAANPILWWIPWE